MKEKTKQGKKDLEDKNTTNLIEEEFEEVKNIIFKCPIDGEIERDEVIFLCNTCSGDELIYKDGIYMCPSCLTPGDNFECIKCGSKNVQMVEKK